MRIKNFLIGIELAADRLHLGINAWRSRWRAPHL
jgi:hypothetical protein